jgi:hypothetical protein
MKAIVVYESMFGNTRHVAEAVADGLRSSIETELVPANDTLGIDLADVQLVVVGAPTHAWGLSRTSTRQGAATDAVKHPDHHLEAGPLEPGVREWLHKLKKQGPRRGVAFDTRLDKPKALTGSAARSIQRGLHAAGFAYFGEAHSFTVTGMAGPLAPGEAERAQQWGEAMGRMLVRITTPLAMPERAGR